jgi:hypothetical protein
LASSVPSIVCVLPDDVCPYDMTVPLKPCITPVTMGSTAP